MDHYTEEVVNEYTPVLELQGLSVRKGWDEEVRDALIDGAQEARIREYTPQDAAQRFKTPESADEWYNDEKKAHVVYSLGAGAVGGVIWFSRQSLPEISDYTFAIRMYSSLRGRHLAGRFMEAAHADFETIVGQDEPTWLSTRVNDNDAAISLYTKHGYKMLSQQGRRYVMLRDPRAIRARLDAQYQAAHELDVI